MKKLILILLLLSIGATGQRRIFSQVTAINGGVEKKGEGHNIFFFDYGSKDVIKAYLSNDDIIYFDKVSAVEVGVDKDGFSYSCAVYCKRNTDLLFIIQVFSAEKKGIKIISEHHELIIELK
jgi:hypothetical protein